MNDQFLFKIFCLLSTIAIILCSPTGCKQSQYSLTNQHKKMYKTPFEEDENYSAAYSEVIHFYKELSDDFASIRMEEIGPSDSGRPLHAVIIGDPEIIDGAAAKSNKKNVLFINNAIHPGEPCGVDASMMIARDLIEKEAFSTFLERTTVIIIPMYNISGALNRGSYSRANQVGPKQYGFRGNVRNYDLNRDFIKCDTRNAQSFNIFFNRWDPDVFIDNHTSNGADYQYVITLIATQKDKLHPELSSHLTEKMLPFLYQNMEKSKYKMTPYVYARSTPDEGIAGFLDLPRYSSGYAALHHTYSFMPETHMLKPYRDRVMSTYYFMQNMLQYLQENGAEVRASRNKAKKYISTQKSFDVNWSLDMKVSTPIIFKGYTADYKPSQVTDKKRLFYDHDRPYEKEVPHYNTYSATHSVDAPESYIIPQAYHEIIERLRWNGVHLKKLSQDTTMTVQVYYIEDYKTTSNPYEGHYLHSEVQVRSEVQQIAFFKGDYIVPANQEKKRYIVEVLEPQAPDSFFAWNFMDGILMQKEYFSSYVFEDTAADLLAKDEILREKFEKKIKEDTVFAGNARAQLNFIYTHSPYYEKTYRRYPIGRIIK